MSYTRELPHDLAAERSVLSALIRDNVLFSVVVDVVNEHDFYQASHALILETMRGMMASGTAIDELTLTHVLTERGTLGEAGGAASVQSIARAALLSGHVREHATIVRDHAVRRNLIRSITAVLELAFSKENTVSELTDQAQSAVLAAIQNDSRQLTWRECVEEAARRALSKEAVSVTGTGLAALDDALAGGLREGELAIVAARPGKGKTVLAMQIARTACRRGKRAAVVTMEMSPIELSDRMMCAEGVVDFGLLRRRNLSCDEWQRFADAAKVIAELSIEVNENIRTMEGVQAWAHTLKMQGKLDVLIIDYLQLLQTEERAESRRHEVEEITRGMKLLAKRLKIPVVLLSQLSRAVENREDGIPELRDLRESGSIEQDADIVVMPHHPAPNMDPERGPIVRPGCCQLWIRKNRNDIGDIYVEARFQGKYMRFVPFEANQEKASAPTPLPPTPAGSGQWAQSTSKPPIPRTSPIVVPPAKPLTPSEQLSLAPAPHSPSRSVPPL